jgi:predicted component of type VI protein secretion system
MLQAELKILGGKHQGKAIPLSTKKFLVGREQDCQLRPNSDLVSRHHCVFSIDDYTVRLRDLGSTNGTRVNGKPLHGEVTLSAGDHIGIGKLELELVVRQRTAAPSTPEPEASTSLLGLSSSELEVVSASATIELPAIPLGNDPVANETSFELPTNFAMPIEDTSTSLAADTSIIPGAVPGSVPTPYPGYAPMPPGGYPGAMPPGYPGAPAYPGYPGQQMGYPSQPMAYPGQYPGYAPQGYGGMPGYPMQVPYPAGYPAPAAPAPAPPADPSGGISVKLPPPESTGVKAAVPAPPPPAAVAGAPADPAGGPPKTEEKPSNTAADIIKNYMQRRTR